MASLQYYIDNRLLRKATHIHHMLRTALLRNAVQSHSFVYYAPRK
jgi:hypothetical protein